MDLRSLIPAVESLAAPLGGILGDGSNGLSGVAARVEAQDFSSLATSLGGVLLSQLGDRLPAAGAGPGAGAAGALTGLSGQLAVPADLLSGVQQPLGDLQRVLGELPDVVGTIQAVATAVQAAQRGDLGPVVSLAGAALMEVVSRAAGPDFAELNDWIAYLVRLGAEMRPVIEAGGDPDELRARLLLLALSRARETIANLAPALTPVLADLGPVVGGLLPDVPSLGLDGLRGAATQALTDLEAAARSAGGDVAGALAQYETDLFSLTDALHDVFDLAEARFTHPLLEPGAISTLATGEIERVMAMQVSDFTNVRGRIESFYADIEEALDAVDLSAVTGQVTGFFQTVQGAVEGVDFGALGTKLDELGAEADRLVGQLQSMITAATARVQDWLGGLRSALQGALSALGSFDGQGRFRFFFQDEIDRLFASMDGFITGDPARPADFSVRGALGDLQAGLLALVEQVEGALGALAGELENAKGALASALEEVRGAVESVNPTAVMEQAKAGLEQAFQEIGGLELDPLVDPVVRELEKARDALAQIDVSELNELLRAALREVLEAIAISDFDRELTRPLLREFDELLTHPRALLASFADKMNELLDKIAAISPASLFAPLQEQIDKVTAALDVDLAAVLQPPLDQAMTAVKRELGRLDPTPLLAPVTEAFGTLSGALDRLDPAIVLRPAEEQIHGLAELVRGLDLDAPLRSVNALFGDIEAFLNAVDPARLLQPLIEPFDEARRVLEGLRPSVLLAPLTEIMDQLGDLTVSVPESVAAEARNLFDEAMTRIDSLDPTRIFQQARDAVGGLRTRLEAVGVAPALHALQTQYAAVRTAVQAADARDGTAFAAELAPLEPTRVFGAVMARSDRALARVRGVLDTLDPAPLVARYEEARGRINELLPRSIRGDITAAQLQTLIGLTDPTQIITRLDTTYQRVVDQLLSINPGLLLGPLSAVHAGLRTVLATLDIGALTARVSAVLDRLAGVIDGISLEALVAPILEGVGDLKAVARGLDPTPIIAGLGDRFRRLLDLFEEVSVRALVTAIADGWNAVVERIRGLFDLAALFEPLTAIVQQIQELLGGADMGELVGVIDDKLDKLRDELEEALNRVGDAFKAMLTAAPL